MPRDTLRAQAARLIRDLNTLVVGASLEELRELAAAVAATGAHITAQMLMVATVAQSRGRLLTMAEVAERLHVSEYIARERGRTGELATVHEGRSVRVEPAEVERYIKEHTHGVREDAAREVRPRLPGPMGASEMAQLPRNGGGPRRRRGRA